jgi:outer membrane protein
VEHLGLDVPGYDPSAYSDLVSGAPVRVPSAQGDRLDRIMERVGRD